MAGILLGSIAIGIIGIIHPEFPVKLPNYAKNYARDHAIDMLFGHAKEPSFEDAIKLAQEKVQEIINPQVKVLNELLKKIEKEKAKSVGERKVSVEDWSKQFKKAREDSEFIKDTWLTGKHLIEGKWKKPKPHPPKQKPKPKPKPPKEPEVTGVKAVIDGTKTYIYIKFKAPKSVKLEYFIRLSGIHAIKPRAERIGDSLVRLVVDAEEVKSAYGFTMEMLSSLRPKLILWFDDKYGRPISEKPYEFDLRPVTLMVDLYGQKWYIVHGGKMYKGECPETDVILLNIEKSAIFSRILPPD